MQSLVIVHRHQSQAIPEVLGQHTFVDHVIMEGIVQLNVNVFYQTAVDFLERKSMILDKHSSKQQIAIK